MTYVFIILSIVVVAVIAQSVIDLYKNQNLTPRQRANLSYLIFMIPLGGTLIYYIFKSHTSLKR